MNVKKVRYDFSSEILVYNALEICHENILENYSGVKTRCLKEYSYCGHVPHLWPLLIPFYNSKSSGDTYFFSRSKDSASKGEVHLSSAS